MAQLAKKFPGTGSIPAAVPAAIEGTVVHDIVRPEALVDGTYRIGHPSGTLAVVVELTVRMQALGLAMPRW